MGLSKKIISDFIDSSVNAPDQAIEMLRRFPELLNARWIHQETVLHFLAVEGFHQAVAFLAQLGWDLNALNEFGASPLMDVVSLGDVEMAEILLRAGADPNVPDKSGDSPLIDAVDHGNVEMADTLLRAGADPNFCSPTLGTALDCSLENGNTKLVELLRSHGALRAEERGRQSHP